MKDRLYILLFALVSMLVLAACQSGSQATQTIIEAELVPTPTQTPTTIPVDRSQYEETFDMIWDTVNEMYFDPTFNGVDWESVRDRYRSKVLAAEDDETFYITLNEMCFELGVSHIAVIPADSPEQLEPVLSAPGSVGIDVRLIDDQVVIAWVEPGSPAEQAGLRTGFIILEINGQPVEDSEDLITFKLPPFNERRYRGQFISAIQSQLNGEVGEEVALIYMDDKDQMHEAALTRQEREVQPFIAENLPPFYVESESRRLENGIGYIRFTGFLPPILEDVLAAVEDMQDAPGIIIDIRGNPGGFYPVRKAIASQFFQERTLLWRYITRPGLELPGFERDVYTDPPSEAYTGPVVILVDVMSGSSSEEFSGALQANQRAIIIGEQTAGSDLVADIISLPNGATFLYPIAQTQTADGTVLEGRGVIPDIEVALDRQLLLQGIDSQIEEAIDYIQNLVEE